MHQPMRGDVMEAIIKERRDTYDQGSLPWDVMDDFLDDYRLMADTGQPYHLESHGHFYVSTYCQHEHEDESLHAQCRLTCKICTAPCSCPRHEENKLDMTSLA
jgi:hypothetical protein